MAEREAPTTEIQHYLRARYPILYIVSPEEQRVERALMGIVAGMDPPMEIMFWSISQGIKGPNNEDRGEKITDPGDALREVLKKAHRYVMVMRDLHRHMVDDNLVIRLLRDVSHELRVSAGQAARTLVIISPVMVLPRELEKEVTVIRFPTPGRADLEPIIEECLRALGDLRPTIEAELEEGGKREQVLTAGLGLTMEEFSNTLARSIVRKKTFDPALISAEKEQIVSKAGILTWIPPRFTFADVAGIDRLKASVKLRAKGFTPAGRAYRLPMPKGVFMVGPGGTAKGLMAKAIAGELGLPCLRLDVGQVMAKYVGESEERIRHAIETAEAIAPCELWFDEINMAWKVGGDDPTSGRVVSFVMTWMGERDPEAPPVYVTATANEVESLPAALYRAGRFDGLWYVPLLNRTERRACLQLKLAEWGRDAAKLLKPAQIDLLMNKTDNFSGAEIEQVVTDALYIGLNADKEPTFDMFIEAVADTKPNYETAKEEHTRLADWAKGRTKLASSPEKAAGTGVRGIEI